jgi:hypothetical protein
MSDIEKEAFRQIGINLINEYRQQRGGFKPIDWLAINTPEASAFIRSIQLHEKTKKELADCKQELADFRQEVSDAVSKAIRFCKDGRPASAAGAIGAFVIPAPKPDPLVEVLVATDDLDYEPQAEAIRAALDALGFEIREKGQ